MPYIGIISCYLIFRCSGLPWQIADREYFYYYTVKIDGIVTGTGRKSKGFAEERKSIEQLVRERYEQTLHIDRRTVLRTFAGSKDFEEYPVEEGAFGWAQTVKSIIRRFENNESYK